MAVTVALLAALVVASVMAEEIIVNNTSHLSYGEPGLVVAEETPVPTAPLTDPTLTFGPVASATAVQQAGLPFSWLTGFAALAGVALLVHVRKG